MKKKVIQKKALAAIMAVSMITGLCPAGALAASGSEVAQDGEYTSSVITAETDEPDDWDSYGVSVTLKVENGEFSSIEVTTDGAYDEGVNGSYLSWAVSSDSTRRKGIQTVLTGQSATEDAVNSWDTVSGATCTSKAIKAAALEAIQAAPAVGTSTIDTTELTKVIAKAEALTEADYTSDSWSAMQTKLTAAKNALSASTQAEIDQAVTDLNKAVSDLVKLSGEYKYVYAGLTWAQYWAAEGVFAAGSTATSSELDSKGEADKGAFDTVSRATTSHGLHRGSFQSDAVIHDTDGKTYEVSYWTGSSDAVLTDGSTITFSRGTITKADGSTATMDYYEVSGIKYVPVKVAVEDYTAFCAKYSVVENGGTLEGGFSESNLASYSVKANVTADTNGLKTATKNADGSFSFSARKTGSDSGIEGASLKTATGIEPTVKNGDGAYGEFLRVDLLGDYGDLGANMQTVEWVYYGEDSTRTTALATYGTKFAADNWMHKSNGIQLGLTDSLRCQLPDGTDGTGYWSLTVYALGYADYTYDFQATAENIVQEDDGEVNYEALKAVIAQAEALVESNYTADSWANLQTELAEAKEALTADTQAVVDEALLHLNQAIGLLVKEVKYVYAGLTWAEYWAAEGVYAAGDTTSSEEVDSKGETDKGAFDTVSRATTSHGLHRGSYQCDAVIYDTEGNTYEVSYWTDGSEAVLTDGSTITFSRGEITKADGSTATMDYYEVSGIKYVPVKVAVEDYDAFCAAYPVVENGGTLAGGYSEQKIEAYSVAANVTADTNGLKTATKNADGSFSFSARVTGSDSGIADTALKTADGIEPEVLTANGSYGEFLRVDLLGDYGGLGATMQAVEWVYYGEDSTRTTALATYGTKFAADNWMHKSNGIQLGLTDSLRCQLPEGTDGTGYWSLTVYALGYEDYTYDFQATAENIVKEEDGEVDYTALTAAIAQAEALTETDYTADSWANMQTELAEAKEALTSDSQAVVDEAQSHLQQAIDGLVKVNEDTEIDTAELEKEIAAAEALAEGDYTAESWSALQTALTAAKEALANKESQEAVDAALSDLQVAINGLVKVNEDTEIDTTEIEKEIAAAEELVESDYTAESWSALQEALAAAKTAVENKESQEAVDAALSTLQSAINGLVKADGDTVVDVDTTALEKAIAAAEALKESDYTADSWKALQTALTAAKAALEAKESQEAVDAATTALNSAISSLVKASTSGTSTTNSTNSSNASSAKTGDSSNILLWLILAIAALAAGGFAWKRKTNMK
ncbi:MAG: penicillin-binding Tp47 domain C-containing protein [Lachnospiraceae bacterium]